MLLQHFKYRLRGLLIIVFTCIAVLEGCIREEPENCGLYLWFELINPKYSFPEWTTSLRLFVYDEAENLVDQHIYTHDMLVTSARGQGVFVPRPATGAGQLYTLIASFNIDEEFFDIIGAENLETHQEALITDRDSIKRYFPDTGFARKSVTFNDHQNTYDTLLITKNSNYINLVMTIDANYNLPETSVVWATLHGMNTRYNCENRPTENNVTTYLPYSSALTRTKTATQVDIALKTMRIWINDNLKMCIWRRDSDGTVTKLYEFFVTADFIVKVKNDQGEYLYDTDEKIQREDVYTIQMSFNGNLTIISVYVNGWYLIHQDIDI